MSNASPRLFNDWLMNVAGRKIAESISMPCNPGSSSASAASTSRVSSRVLPHGNFSTMSIRPGPSLMTASPMSGWWSMSTLATWPRVRTWPSRWASGIFASVSGVVIGRTLATLRRWLGVSTNPPVPIIAPSENCSSPESRASAVTVISWFSVIPFWSSLSGSTWTCSISSRSPQMATFATPGTCIRRWRIRQYDVIDMSMREYSSDDKPIFIARLVAESGCSMIGGLAQRGRPGVARASRSWTNCREVMRSVPGWKISLMDERSATDFERMTSRSGTPFRASSRGTVTSSSTSAGDRPSAAVCTSTCGGANSGKTSTGACGSW